MNNNPISAYTKTSSLKKTLLLLVILFGFCASKLPAQSQRLYFNLLDPNEASKWIVNEHDASQGQAGLSQKGFFIASGEMQTAFMERNVIIPAGYYNRVIVEMYGEANHDQSGFGGCQFFFSNTGNIIPEARVESIFPENTYSQVVFELEQSLLWSGSIRKIRLDPVIGGGLAYVKSITLDKAPAQEIAPKWQFNTNESTIGWLIGEFAPKTGVFFSSPKTITPNGMEMTVKADNPVLINRTASLNTQLIKSFEIDLINNTGQNTISRIYWRTPDVPSITEERMFQIPVNASSSLQKIHFPLSEHEMWKGQVVELLINPVKAPGKVTINAIKFNAADNVQDFQTPVVQTLNWRTHQEASHQINQGLTKPLLVLISKEGNTYASKIEQELATNPDFLQLSNNFFPVRLETDDPVTSRVFGRLYRVPILIVMTYNSYTGKWEEQSRLQGPEASKNAVATLQTYK